MKGIPWSGIPGCDCPPRPVVQQAARRLADLGHPAFDLWSGQSFENTPDRLGRDLGRSYEARDIHFRRVATGYLLVKEAESNSSDPYYLKWLVTPGGVIFVAEHGGFDSGPRGERPIRLARAAFYDIDRTPIPTTLGKTPFSTSLKTRNQPLRLDLFTTSGPGGCPPREASDDDIRVATADAVRAGTTYVRRKYEALSMLTVDGLQRR